MLLMAGIGGTSLFLILAYDAVTQSPYFEARTITVEGNQWLSKETILKQAGLKLRENILSVNLAAVRYRLMALPMVAAAEIDRELPDAIHIRVRERIPVAIVDLDPHFYLDEEGKMFRSVESPDNVMLPVVTGLALSDIDSSDSSSPRLIGAVMEVLRLSRLYQNVIPSHALRRIHIDREMGLTLYAFLPECNMTATPDGTPAFSSSTDGRSIGQSLVAIKVGFGDYESKYKRLQDMIFYLKKERTFLNLQCIDLNDLDRVVVRPSLIGGAGSRYIDPWPGRRKEV
ncbi:MAG: hypothetical protein DRH17_02805 [Deltaproteobacteria bacterium]|nr:MAG: hypothetical protein DRH17_02805 [Deltaproteobacteria bacterium]